jgi:ketosteroid isomerase-like protein
MKRAASWVFAVLLIAAACEKKMDDTPVVLEPVPMPDSAAIPMTIATNNALIDFQWILGDRTALATWYADSTEVTVLGIGSYRGPAALDSNWTGRATELGVTNFTRTSQGLVVDGRTVLDTGTYVLEGERVQAGVMKDMTGRYKIRWFLTDDGKWLIRSDSIIGASQQ